MNVMRPLLEGIAQLSLTDITDMKANCTAEIIEMEKEEQRQEVQGKMVSAVFDCTPRLGEVRDAAAIRPGSRWQSSGCPEASARRVCCQIHERDSRLHFSAAIGSAAVGRRDCAVHERLPSFAVSSQRGLT